MEDKSLGKSLLPPNRRETSANRKTKTAHRKDKNQESLKRNRGSAGFPPRKDISDVSNKKSDKQELKPNHCKVQTGKRKRGTERRVSSKKQSCQDPEPLPAYCQEIAPRNEPIKSTHRRIEKDPSIEVKLKVGDERLTNIDENINKPNGTEKKWEIFRFLMIGQKSRTWHCAKLTSVPDHPHISGRKFQKWYLVFTLLMFYGTKFFADQFGSFSSGIYKDSNALF